MVMPRSRSIPWNRAPAPPFSRSAIAGLLDQTVGKGRFAMVDVGDDGEVADIVDRMRGHGESLARGIPAQDIGGKGLRNWAGGHAVGPSTSSPPRIDWSPALPLTRSPYRPPVQLTSPLDPPTDPVAKPEALPRVLLTLMPVMGVLFVAYLIVGIAMPVLPLHLNLGLGQSAFVVGLVGSMQYITALFSRMWAGVYSDAHGAKQA